MMIQLALGMMNPIVMVGIAFIVAVEKLAPRAEWTVRVVGLAAVAVGISSIARTVLIH